MPQTTYDIAAQVAAVNALLHGGEPGNISVDTYSNFTGYKPQHIIDAMNEAFGLGNWGFEEVSNEVLGDDKAILAISQVRVFLKDCAFQPTGWGQARVTKGDVGDAKKGAQTDAIKKALSYFSIGNRAYHGLLIAPPQEGQNQANRQGTGRTQQNAPGTNRTPTRGNLAVVPQNGTEPSPLLGALQEMYIYARDLGLSKDIVEWEKLKVDILGNALHDEEMQASDVEKMRKGLAERKKKVANKK